MAPNNGYIYVIMPREFINAKQDILKIGKTKNLFKICAQYPKGSLLLFLKYVIDDHHTENQIYAQLCQQFRQRTDIGQKYFEGYSDAIIHIIENTIQQLEHDVNTQKFGLRCFYDDHPHVKKKHTNIEKYIISSFYSENKQKYIDKIVPSQDVYQDFLRWLSIHHSDKRLDISKKTFTHALKDMYNITTNTHRFPHGVFLCMCFETYHAQKEQRILQFIQKYIQKTDDMQQFVTFKNINDAFKSSEFYNGEAIKVHDIETILHIKCFPQKKINRKNLVNVFLGLKINFAL